MHAKVPNKLQHETSPYLLQHAYNPVQWYPWGEEALQKALTQNKPILVSIGYAACHWCHVMERESFESQQTADFMNEHFVNIKIDREERPDLDHIYMDAVQAMTGSGGWPLNVFLTPNKKPFYGGTYFPPQPIHNRPSWLEVLTGVSNAFKDKKEEIEAQANNLTEHLLKSNSFGINIPAKTAINELFTPNSLNTIAANLLLQADTVSGGFGQAPKFPQTFSIQYLLRHYHYTHDEAALKQALLSLDKMILGGIYDQLGGGFARYSTDKDWIVPHFEKMLYDNALILGVLAEAYQLTKLPQYKATIHHTMEFIQREMFNAEQAFYSALDADSEGVEGKFYTWSKAEIETVLGTDATFFLNYYQVTEAGNWAEGAHETPPSNILWGTYYADEIEQEKITEARQKLMAVRAKRIRPQLDDKILLGWNALMNTACSKAFAATGEIKYQTMAINNMAFLEKAFTQKKQTYWYHTYKNGQAKIPAFLDDYAYLIQAYIHLQEITGNQTYLLKAKSLTEWVINSFSEEATGFFFYTPHEQQDIIVRKKEVYDGATPSGNAIMVNNLRYLSLVFDIPEWTERASFLVQSLQNALLKHPTSFGCWAMALQNIVIGEVEIMITGHQAPQFLYQINENYYPNKIILAAETNPTNFPLLSGKSFNKGKTSFYLCRNSVCEPAFASIKQLLANM